MQMNKGVTMERANFEDEMVFFQFRLENAHVY